MYMQQACINSVLQSYVLCTSIIIYIINYLLSYTLMLTFEPVLPPMNTNPY
ncbi:hypothetical protein V8C86DRAFT_3133016 [Haematococcus lacustris]